MAASPDRDSADLLVDKCLLPLIRFQEASEEATSRTTADVKAPGVRLLRIEGASVGLTPRRKDDYYWPH